MQDNVDNHIALWWQKIRNEELTTALEAFTDQKNLKILEIGGRDGYQAKLISKKDYDVTSIDINPIDPQFFPVQKGTISQLKFQENSFDIIYSSNMLQEIQNIEETFKEMKKILKKDGIIIHIVPSCWWSLITNFWHYCFIPKYLIKSKKFQHIFNSDLKEILISRAIIIINKNIDVLIRALNITKVLKIYFIYSILNKSNIFFFLF